MGNGEKKSMCHLPLSYPTTTIEKLLLLVGAVIAGSGVWQDCQSFPTHTLHQQIQPHDGKKNDYAPHSILSTTHYLHCLFIPHESLFIFLTHKLHSCLVSRSPERGAVSIVIHIFHTEESSVFQSVFGIWCESSLTH